MMFASTMQCLAQHTYTPLVCGLLVVSVVIVAGKRPVPFRTRKLSLVTLMVLHSGGCGRVGYRRPKT